MTTFGTSAILFQAGTSLKTRQQDRANYVKFLRHKQTSNDFFETYQSVKSKFDSLRSRYGTNLVEILPEVIQIRDRLTNSALQSGLVFPSETWESYDKNVAPFFMLLGLTFGIASRSGLENLIPYSSVSLSQDQFQRLVFPYVMTFPPEPNLRKIVTASVLVEFTRISIEDRSCFKLSENIKLSSDRTSLDMKIVPYGISSRFSIPFLYGLGIKNSMFKRPVVCPHQDACDCLDINNPGMTSREKEENTK